MLSNPAAPHVSFIYDLDKQDFLFVDPVFQKFFLQNPEGLTQEELLLEVVPQDRDYVKSTLLDVADGKLNAGFEFRLRKRVGYRWIRLAPVLAGSAGKRTLSGIAADVTAQVKNDLNVQKYSNKKNSVLNILAHDLRGPLSIARSLSQMIDKQVGDTRLSDAAKQINHIVKQSIGLISDLLEREFLDSMSIQVSKKRVDIAAKIADYMEEYRNSEWKSERTFHYTASAQNIFIEVDESKFIQLMNNLLSNALKFTRKHGKISAIVTDQEKSVLFAFSDDGIGIQDEYHAVLFEKFTPARRQGLNGEPTLGLGMSVVKTIVELHQGKIWFESNENTGTTFFIELPKTS